MILGRPVSSLLLVVAVCGVAAAADTWTGFSVGIDATYAKYTAQWDDRDYWWYGGSLDEPYWGVLGGIRVGYDHQWDSLVLGIDAAADFGDIRGHHAEDVSSGTGQARISMHDTFDRDVELRVRAGLAVERTLLYLMAGPAWVSVSHNWHAVTSGPDSSTQTFHNQRQGYVIGIGLERIIAPHWSVNGDLFQLQIPDAAGSLGNRDHLFVSEKLTGVQLGLNYRF